MQVVGQTPVTITYFNPFLVLCLPSSNQISTRGGVIILKGGATRAQVNLQISFAGHLARGKAAGSLQLTTWDRSRKVATTLDALSQTISEAKWR